MKWYEFRALISGLNGETPLGRVVCIRAEEDKDILETFTKDMHSIRNKWRTKQAKKKDPQDTERFLEEMKNIFISMAK